MAGKYIGALLIERGLLSAEQVEAVLSRQKQTNQRFGELAVEMFRVRTVDIWRALADQRKEELPRVDLDVMDPPTKSALAAIPGRLAWASRVLPLKVEGERLICATTAKQLCDAMALLHEKVDRPIDFVLAEELQLKQHIMACYPG